jgi:hypothetical protein
VAGLEFSLREYLEFLDELEEEREAMLDDI